MKSFPLTWPSAPSGVVQCFLGDLLGVAGRVVWGDIVVYVGGDVVLNVLGEDTMAVFCNGCVTVF